MTAARETAYASDARIRGTFDLARQRVAIEDLVERAGLKIVRGRNEHRSACPLCGAGAGSRSVFQIKGEKWRCWSCERHGDVVDLEQALGGGSALDAAARLLGGDMPVRQAVARAAAPAGPSNADRLAAELWREGRPFAGTLGDRYLRHRGIHPEVIAQAAGNLRFHSRAKHSWDDRAAIWRTAPAMIAQVVTRTGPTGGVHVTYLAADGSGKSPSLSPAKRMWGPQLDADGRPGGAWLIGPQGEGRLAVAEGIETVLSLVTLARRAGLPMRACAALSLGRLQGGFQRDDDGCVDAIRPLADPAAPAFTWPDGTWSEVIVGVDRDMAEIKVKARTGRGRICEFLLTAQTRARICGRLSTEAWKAAGPWSVRAVAPSPGCDFNDELRRVLAREGGA